MFCFPAKKAGFVGLFLLTAGLLVNGCQAREMLSNTMQKYTDTAKLANYSFTSADKFGVVVTFAGDAPKSMHQSVMAPLTDKLAIMLTEELGVTAISIEEGVFNRWRDDQLANRASPEGEKTADLDESLFFRQAGYRGFMRVVATELVDGAARNDFDYSLRTKFALRILETTEEGDISPALAKFTTIRAVCSRRYRSKDISSHAARLSEGYELTNVQRCAATPVYRAKLRLAEEK